MRRDTRLETAPPSSIVQDPRQVPEKLTGNAQLTFRLIVFCSNLTDEALEPVS